MKFLENIYKNHYKKLLIIPMLILLLALIQISTQIATTGDFINKGISLKGGTTITISENLNIDEIKDIINQNLPNKEINVRTLSSSNVNLGIIIDSETITSDEVLIIINSIETKQGKLKDYTVENIGSSLGESFFKDTIKAMIFAFLFMGIVVFYYFRIPIPSLAVILAAFSDIVVSIAIVNLLDIKVGTAGIAAFLMLIGYSVDTDILLSTRVLKRKEGTIYDRVISALKTGLTMNLTTLSALLVALYFSNSPVLSQIMTILLIGLVIDIMNTWIQNAGILRWYMEKKHNES